MSFFKSTKKRKNAFIAESYIGSHADIGFFNADLISFTFAPNLKISEPSCLNNISIPKGFRGIWVNGINILKKFQKTDVCRELAMSEYEYFIIGMDNDFEGNGMAKLLQVGLINEGISPERIVRVPLNYNGYTEVTDFWDDDTFFEYVCDKWDDMAYLNHSKKVMGKTGAIGRRIAYMLSEMINPPDCVENLNSNGTSTITYLFKKAINEK